MVQCGCGLCSIFSLGGFEFSNFVYFLADLSSMSDESPGVSLLLRLNVKQTYNLLALASC
jgi:hypothetical protein